MRKDDVFVRAKDEELDNDEESRGSSLCGSVRSVTRCSSLCCEGSRPADETDIDEQLPDGPLVEEISVDLMLPVFPSPKSMILNEVITSV